MNGRAQLEIVMEYNIMARARVDHTVWAPCATSTPIRKPLLALNNPGITDGLRKFHVLPSMPEYRALTVETAEVRPSEKRNKNVVKKKSNKNSRVLHILDDDDDDDDSEDTNTNGQSKKPLIIKLSSDQYNKRSLRKKRNLMERDPSCSKEGKDSDNPDSVKLVNGNVLEKCSKSKNSNTLHETQNVKECGENAGALDLKGSQAFDVKITKNKKIMKKQADIHESISDEIHSKEANDILPQKRKNKSTKLSHAKKIKTGTNHPISLENIETKKKSELINNKVKCFEKIGHPANIVKQDLARLPVSHEIFSDSKEKELRDSIDMTAVDQEELPICDSNDVKLPNKQKVLSKWKNTISRQSKRSENCNMSDKSELTRSGRLKKSPKKFWLPKTETKKEQFPDNNNDGEAGKDVKVSQSISSSEKSDKSKILASEVSSSNDVGSSGLPSDAVYVKTISELDFVEIGLEDEMKKFSVATGWQSSKFKCCALKIGAKCEASNTNSSCHFGGIVIKGRLSMKIGKTEVKVKGGHMFYIPPLTDWRAINIGRVDCLLYYWVGKM